MAKLKMDNRRMVYHGIIRAFTVLMVFCLQIGFIWNLFVYMQMYAMELYFALELLSITCVFALVNEDDSNRQFWIILILAFPGFGFILYFMWGSKRSNSRMNRRIRQIEANMKANLIQDPVIADEFAKIHPNKVQIARYLERDGFSIYKNTKMKYYPSGESMNEDFLQDLKNAKKFIFLEYYIIYDGEWWKQILEILEQKVKEGVEVLLLVDDFGCLFMDARLLKKELTEKGIKMVAYGPIDKRITSLSFNYRNHQKITVIDGNIGYTGGINLADEYINLITRFGHWKDTAIRLEGDAVYSLTNIFLEMWEYSGGEKKEPAEHYLPETKVKDEGFVQPFAGGPHRYPNNPIAGVYNRMIDKARDYIYITTPYLVLDERLIDNITQAAQSGVDVKIIVPHIYDKWYVYMVNVSNYGRLIKSGVKIYEYTPGFIHAKNIISDDECAVCGTINLDYRSLYLHYENGVFFSENQAVHDMKQDFLDTMEQSHCVTYEEWEKRPVMHKLIQWMLKIWSPLL